MNWIICHWNELTTAQLHALLNLRQDVFVIEQQCIYPDIDETDRAAVHVMLFNNNTACLAYARIYKLKNEIHFGRFCTARSLRKKGWGHTLMKKVLETVKNNYGTCEIVIAAQLYLTQFYGSYGFIAYGNEYLEDGIPHILMKRERNSG